MLQLHGAGHRSGGTRQALSLILESKAAFTAEPVAQRFLTAQVARNLSCSLCRWGSGTCHIAAQLRERVMVSTDDLFLQI